MKHYFILGATGVGKSELALAWARRQRAAILSLDSMQIYRGLDIGTGKPTSAEQREISHGGLDLIDPGEPFSVAHYLDYARHFLTQHSRVIMAGGTGLYYRGLTQGFCEAPASDPVRQAELEGWKVEALQSRLRELDPLMWSRVDQYNPRRLIRAIQVVEESGISLAEWQQRQGPPLIPTFQTVWLQRETEEHQQRIRRRVAAMFEQGWIAEVERLLARHGPEVLNRVQAIGYPEIAEALVSGRNPYDWQETIVTATWQYARRQLTWFRKERNVAVLKLSDSARPRPLDALESLLAAP